MTDLAVFLLEKRLLFNRCLCVQKHRTKTTKIKIVVHIRRNTKGVGYDILKSLSFKKQIRKYATLSSYLIVIIKFEGGLEVHDKSLTLKS